VLRKKTTEMIIILLILVDSSVLLMEVFFNSTIGIYITYFDLFVCIVLAIDFIYNYKEVNDKKKFLKTHILDIIAMIPDYFLSGILIIFGLSGATGIIRLLRFIRLGRVLLLFRKNIKLFTDFIKETQLDKLLMISVLVVVISSILISFIDPRINNWGEGLWYVLVTFSTVGYGDIVPSTYEGKAIGIFLIIGGVLVFSTLTGAISSIYTKRIEENTRIDLENRLDRLEKKIDTLNNSLDEIKREK